jgi:hypothetical protein
VVGGDEERSAYADFRRSLEALPGHQAFEQLVREYSLRWGLRAVGRWIVGPLPRTKDT